MDGGRINIAACSVGGAAYCLDYARDYVQSRSQFGRAIASFQATQFRLADMATQVQASRLMVRCGNGATGGRNMELSGATCNGPG